MSERDPDKSDIIAIFKRLRAIPSNKVCFDCGAKNPTWASVTYGVFICIDCSAVHRSLGVHLSFVRSTQLDTNWTWIQLRGMQVGGNANAVVFFQQHNCTSTDAQQKYNSRAAQLYREKLTNLAATAMKLHGTKVHVDTGHSDVPGSPEVKDSDFFEEHSEAALFHHTDDYDGLQNGSTSFPRKIIDNGNNNPEGPNIEPALSTSPTEAQKVQQVRKSTIGTRRTTASKGLGAKKGLGAQKVSADFGEIEKEAQRCDQLRAQALTQDKQTSKADEERNIASVRLAYQDLSVQQKKTEEKLRQTDPRKAAQLERLGMGFGGSRSSAASGLSHSAASDMKVIQQENPLRTSAGSRSRDLDEDFEFVGFSSGPPKYGDSPFMSRNDDRNVDKFLKDTWGDEKIDRKGSFSETILPLERDENTGRSRKGQSHSASSTPVGDEAQKKFGNAKSISSEQFFGGPRDFDYERRANLAKFEGSSSISSADYFGGGSQRVKEPAFNGPNLYDIKEGVRDGVNKVAGRLSSLASGVMSSLQDRYGY